MEHKKSPKLIVVVIVIILFFPFIGGSVSNTILYPNAAGTDTAWSWIGGSTDYTNWQSQDIDVTYATGGTGNNADQSVNLDNSILSGTIYNVTAFLTVRGETAGEDLEHKLYVGAVAYISGSEFTPTLSYANYSYTWINSPSTSTTWTWAEINGAEIGVETDKQDSAQRITAAWLVVEYEVSVDNIPQWFTPSVNDSTPDPSEEVRHNVYWTDDNTMSYATLEVNATGASCNTWDNVTSTTLSTGSEWANLTYTIPGACEGKTIGWRQYANDSNNQWNLSSTGIYNVQEVFPSFSNHQKNPATPNEDQNVQVNATIIEASLDTVTLELEGTTNYTISTNNGDEFYYTILQGNYTAHDSVTYYWYANDSSGNMNKSSQQSFTVTNQIPSVSQPVINNTTPYTNELISCNSGTFSDNDAEDTESSREFMWYENNIEISGQTSQTLDLTIAGLDKVDVFICSIRVSDSYDWSSWQNSSNTATIQNSNPIISNPQITVTWNANGSTYTYDYEVTDLDSDSFTWYDNSSLFNIDSSTGEISDTPTEDQKGTYAIEINVSDGTVNTTDVFLYTINDPNAPIINLVDPTENPGVIVPQDYIEINVTASDSNLDTITIRLYDSNNNLLNISYSNTSPFYSQYPSLSSGIYFYNATANDTETNSADIGTRNITLNADPPTLTIISPEDETYLSNESLLLNYSVNGEDFRWYNIDLGSNTTISTPTYFNTTQGPHILYLYANNSFGTTIDTISFTTNSTKFIIYYDEFKGQNKGSSTRFNQKKFSEIQNLSNIVLENSQFGKIEFNEAINMTNDLISNDNILDLDSYTNISFNRIELDATNISNFNKSATLYLYNLTFSNPRILKDGNICPSAICVENTHSGGILSFNVTGFSVYSTEETPGTPVTPPGGGGGEASYECTQDSDCKEKDEICLGNSCVNLFDIKIINFPSPIETGDFFEFTYFMKGMEGVNGDVEVSFWIEKDNKETSSGKDIIYLNEFEEKTETTKIFIPSTSEPGVYEFFVQVKYEDYTVHASRTIEIQSKVRKSETSSEKRFNFIPIYYFLGILLFLILLFFLVPLFKKINWPSKEERERKKEIQRFLKQEKLRELKEEKQIILKTKKIFVPRPKQEIPGIKHEFDHEPEFKDLREISKDHEQIKEKPKQTKDIIQDIADKERDHKLVEQNHKELEVPKPSVIHRSKQEILDNLKKQFEKEEIYLPIKKVQKEFKKKPKEFDIIQDIVKKEKQVGGKLVENSHNSKDIIQDMVEKEEQKRKKFIKDNFDSEDIIEDMVEKEEENGKFG